MPNAVIMLKTAERVPRERIDKFAERRAELAAAAVQTLSELGYARTTLREIAQHSDFSHGVLHYYFTDKVDLITCCVRQYKERCVTRYDGITAQATDYAELLDGFVDGLATTVRDEAHLHRLWYDLRAQALFEPAFREDVRAIDKSLEDMIWRIASKLYEFAGTEPQMTSSALYALFDGLFQQCLLAHIAQQPAAIPELRANVRSLVAAIVGPIDDGRPLRRRRSSRAVTR